MTRYVASLIYEGPDQCRRIAAVRLEDGEEITSELAIAMMENRGEIYRLPDGHNLSVFHRKVFIAELSA